MSVVEPSPAPAPSNLFQRVQDILLRPKPTWEVIDVEPATTRSLFVGYACILAAIPPIASLIGGQLFGLGGIFHPSLVAAIVMAVVSYLLSLLGVFIVGLVIDALAPSFDGQKNRVQAMKAAIYPYTAAWVAGVLGIFPPLMPLVLLASLYGLYLLYLGLPKLMKAPQEKALGYTIVTIIVAIVLSLVIGAVVGGITTMGMFAGGSTFAHNSTVKVGDKSVDLGQLAAASKQMEAAAKQVGDGDAVQPVDVELLKARLPAAVAGFNRTEVSTGSGGVGGIQGASAEAKYAKGDAKISLSVVDMGAAGALAGMAGAFNVKSSNESDGKYEKVGRVDGRMTMEQFDKNSGHGEYTVMVGDRFMVAAEGDGGATIGDLKSAVAATDLSRLESMSKS